MPTAVKLVIEDDDVVEENDIDEKDDKSEPESDSAAPGLWPALWSAGDDDDDNDKAKSAPGMSSEEALREIEAGVVDHVVDEGLGKIDEGLGKAYDKGVAKVTEAAITIKRRVLAPCSCLNPVADFIEKLIHLLANENRWIGNNASDRPPPRRATRTSSSSGLP